MASLARALKTDIMADLDLKGLAQILKSRGRKGDTILAHISPAEAKLLKKRGGSGKSNPETGLPEFALESDPDSFSQSFAQPAYVPPSTSQGMDTYEPGPRQLAPTSASDAAQYQGNQAFPQATQDYVPQFTPPVGGGGSNATTVVPTAAPTTVGAPQPLATSEATQPATQPATQTKPPPPESTFDKALKALQDPSNLLKLGLGGLGVGMGMQQSAGARKQAADAQAQYAKLGQPFQAQGNEMMRAAQAGELSPQSRQAFQAAQAQSAQQTANQGGVGQQQAATQLGALYSKLLENQNTLGLSLVQVGDTYAAQGIQAGLQANQQLQSMTANYYSTLARMLVPSMAGTATPGKPV